MNRTLTLISAGLQQSASVRYGAAAALVALSVLARLGLDLILPGYTFLLWYPVVFTVALLFGRGAAALAIALYALAASFIWMPPRYSFVIEAPEQLIALAIFVVSCAGVVWLTSLMHVALADASAAEREKDVLLHAFHHRIRNDFQSIIALLFLAHSRQDDREALIEAARARIDVTSRVYSRLRYHRAETSVDAKEFIETLVADLHTSIAGLQPVAMHADADPVALDADCAVSIGIIVNELVTDALKHAFPDDRPGRIDVTFHCEADDCVLRVSNDGVAIASAPPPGTNLGSRLMRQLAKQLQGTLETKSNGNVVSELRFPLAAASRS